MPFDEHNVKWSCEPCIRGHRSSKCAHFDRLMVSVGKAGRPLSKCPHVEGSCNCKKLCAFMVAIPKGTGCLCRPVYKMLLDENGPTPAVSRLPLDLTAGPEPSPGPSPSKIQKSGKKYAKPAPEQVNRALSSIPQYHQYAIQNGSPALSPYVPQPQMTGYTYNAINGTLPDPNGFPAPNNVPNNLGLPENALTTGIYHSDHFQSPTQSNDSIPTQTRGSCCASRGESVNDIKAEPNALAPNRFNALPLAASQMAEASSSTWQTYPSMNGHFSPLNGTTNRYQPALSGFTNQISPKDYTNTADLEFDHLPTSQPTPVGAPEFTGHLTTTHTNGASHNCNCGPKCNCYACPDHPYNEVTVQHVQEMGLIIAQDTQTFDNQNNHQTVHINGNHPNGHHMGQPLVDPEPHLSHGYDPMPGEECCGIDDRAPDFHDVQALDSFSADHLMAPGAYYTYEYQIGLPGACAGEAGDCQCGPSCSCLGCLTHGNPE
ncbi:hypothetical protein BDW59DRAFT_56571 [Aspergillus cavernicola]|uniref:Copper-fist domain-containing protein n=1 Tax=Aspergillus cavernicola TaxID=176166 RepID=A0ABR4ILI7_9EURO